jgi:hypothetical protein
VSSYTNTTPILTHYELGVTNLGSEIPYNGDGWDMETGTVKPVVTLFATNPERVVLSLFAAQGGGINRDDLAPIQAKIGLEYLVRESAEIYSNRTTLVFHGPKKPRYQTGLQVCFLGFIRPQDLGRKDAVLRLASVSFVGTGTISTNPASLADQTGR